MINPIHHLHVRKRIHSKKEQYPNPKKFIALLDKLLVVVGVLTAVATVPQLTQIWIGQDATGVSVISWAYYSFAAAMFLVYGIVHKEKPIVINYSIAVTLDLLVTIGTILYS